MYVNESLLQPNEKKVKYNSLNLEDRFHIPERHGVSHFVKTDRQKGRCVNDGDSPKYCDGFEYAFYSMDYVVIYVDSLVDKLKEIIKECEK